MRITIVNDKVGELAQKLYNDDGYSGNIYKKASVQMLRFYEGKALTILEDEPLNCEPAWCHLRSSVLKRS